MRYIADVRDRLMPAGRVSRLNSRTEKGGLQPIHRHLAQEPLQELTAPDSKKAGVRLKVLFSFCPH